MPFYIAPAKTMHPCLPAILAMAALVLASDPSWDLQKETYDAMVSCLARVPSLASLHRLLPLATVV